MWDRMNQTQKEILAKLTDEKCFNDRHILEENLQKNFPRHKRGTVKDDLKELVKQRYIVKKPTKNGMAYYLNMSKIGEIRRILENL